MKVKTFSYHRINIFLLSLLHEILTIGDIYLKRSQKLVDLLTCQSKEERRLTSRKLEEGLFLIS